MAISDEITRLQSAKSALKTSIEGKGVTVSSSAKLEDYPALVDSIEVGDDWVYVNCNTLTDSTNPGAKAGSRFYVQFTNSSNLIVEFMPPYETSINPRPTWTSNKLISEELNVPTDYLIRYRIKPGVNMAVGDIGTLTITNSSGTVIYTFKLVKTFSNTAVLNTQSVDDGADIEKLNVSGGTAPYIVNPLNGGTFGSETLANSSITHQYQVSSGNIVQCSISCMGEYPALYPNQNLPEYYGSFPITMLLRDAWSLQYSAGYLSITPTGLLSITSQRSSSDVNEYPWLPLQHIVVVMLKLDSGVWLIDTFIPYINYTCFIKGTKISLANGEKINVEDVDYDTELLVWNFDDGKYDKAKPLWIKKAQTTTWYYKLKFSNGLELNVTGAYPEAHSLFSVEDGKFIHSNRLVGKKVYTLNGIATLDSCEEIHEEVEFYNIFTYYHLNLFANDVLTSTSLNNIYPIKDMKFIKTQREPVFDYTQFSDNWIVGARLKEQPTDVTKYCLEHIELSK